jgi:hypothetical protein
MSIFKTMDFAEWARDEGLTDEALHTAVQEMEQGLINANLGGNVYKKRVAIRGRGKSGGLRTIVAFKKEDKAFFIYGFAKNKRDNIKDTELKALKLLAKELFGYTDQALEKAIEAGQLIEVQEP